MHKVIKLFLVALCLSLISVFFNHANAAVLPLQNPTSTINLKSHWQVLEDKSGKLTINDILHVERAQATNTDTKQASSISFKNLAGDLSASYTQSVYWLKLELQRQDPSVSN
jgi:hypothetical protein